MRVRLTEEVGDFRPPAWGTVQCVAPDIVGIRFGEGLLGLLTWTDLGALERQVDPDGPDGRDGRMAKHRELVRLDRPVAWNDQWGSTMWIDAELRDLMREHGYEPWHMGGGCMAWGCAYGDEGYDLVTYVDVGLGSWNVRGEAEWLHGTYDREGDEAAVWSGLTLAEALDGPQG
jgi:hypothetical protein